MKIARMLFLIAVVAAITTWLLAAQAQRKSEKDGTTTVTGCLAKGDEPNEFDLTADNGKRYELRSDKVSLSNHVGHKITVTGTSVKESDEDKDRDEAQEKESAEHTVGNLQVTNVQMVSTSCK